MIYNKTRSSKCLLNLQIAKANKKANNIKKPNPK